MLKNRGERYMIIRGAFRNCKQQKESMTPELAYDLLCGGEAARKFVFFPCVTICHGV
jgi:hypothetical protein